MLSIIIPYYGNDELRNKALYSLFDSLKKQDYKGEKEIIFVNQGKLLDDFFFTYISPICNRTIFLDREAIYKFNKSWCINVGVREAKYPTIIVIDADMQLGVDYLRLMNYFQNCESKKGFPFFIGWSHLLCLSGRDCSVIRHVTPLFTQAAGGVFIFDKNFFVKELGMMNENYEGYGGEDNDLFYRAQYVLNHKYGKGIFYAPYALIHSYHHWEKVNNINVLLTENSRLEPYIIIDRLKSVFLGDKLKPTHINVK